MQLLEPIECCLLTRRESAKTQQDALLFTRGDYLHNILLVLNLLMYGLCLMQMCGWGPWSVFSVNFCHLLVRLACLLDCGTAYICGLLTSQTVWTQPLYQSFPTRNQLTLDLPMHLIANCHVAYPCPLQCYTFYITCLSDRVKHTHTPVLWLSGFCLGQLGWAGTRKKHSPTHTYRGRESSLICFLLLLCSMASSLFN